MKAICIDNAFTDLTLNKVYDVEYIPMCKNPSKGRIPCYTLISDTGREKIFARSRFISMSKIRYDKLNQLGI